jgi:hypothetical protein
VPEEPEETVLSMKETKRREGRDRDAERDGLFCAPSHLKLPNVSCIFRPRSAPFSFPHQAIVNIVNLPSRVKDIVWRILSSRSAIMLVRHRLVNLVRIRH